MNGVHNQPISVYRIDTPLYLLCSSARSLSRTGSGILRPHSAKEIAALKVLPGPATHTHTHQNPLCPPPDPATALSPLPLSLCLSLSLSVSPQSTVKAQAQAQEKTEARVKELTSAILELKAMTEAAFVGGSAPPGARTTKAARAARKAGVIRARNAGKK